jgi:hypothetical protein
MDITYTKDIKGAFDSLTDAQKDVAINIASNFHYRNGFRNEDGSLGSVKVGYREFIDCLAYALKMVP